MIDVFFISDLGKATLDWIQSEFNTTDISFLPFESRNRNSKLFNATIGNKRYFLIIRLERNTVNETFAYPRNKDEVLREIFAYNTSNINAPALIKYNINIGAMLFEEIDQQFADTVTLIREFDDESLFRFLKPLISSLALIHSSSLSNNSLFKSSKNDTYSYINYYAQKVKPGITLPIFQEKIYLLHGNTNPRNWIQLKNRGFWIDFEDTHTGMPEFDYGYLLGHLRIIKSDLIQGGYLHLLKECGLNLDNECIIGTSQVVIYYIQSTETFLKRYPFIMTYENNNI